MTYQGERGPVTPRLPDPGWLPDPARTDVERYWDGRAWTSRTRDRVSKLERVPLPAYAYAPARPRRRTRAWARWTLGLMAVGAVWLGVTAYEGQLPAWVPYGDALVRDQPAPAAVAYPVFGSNDLVTYLAAAMVAQQDSIDVSYWSRVQGMSVEELKDAIYEAATQNPYLFVSAWSVDAMGTVVPQYTYDRDTAESRRYLTSNAVAQAVADAGVASATTAAQKVAAIHDYIANAATYDVGSYEAITAGATAESLLVAQSQQAYGILVAHTAVCSGYAQAFQLVAQAAGLESMIVTGTADGLTSGGHAWNEVLIDGTWLVVDVTWDDDDVNGIVHTDYLLIPTNDPALASRSMDLDWVVDANVGRYGI